MKRSTLKTMCTVGLLLMTAAACEGTDPGLPIGNMAVEEVYFVGYVYDGVQGHRLKDYALRLKFGDLDVAALVDPDGRYIVGPLLSHNDYSIIVEATDYRTFESHNARRRSNREEESLQYDAYLYPKGLVSPAQTLRAQLSNSDLAPAGMIRFRPTSGSSLFDSAVETPVGVGRQIWENDADVQLQTVLKGFGDGVIELVEGELVYGVTYEVTVFAVDGYRELATRFTSGVDGPRTLTLAEQTEQALDVVYISTELRQPSVDGAVSFVFNQPVSFDPFFGSNAVAVADIDTRDDDGDQIYNRLKSPIDTRIDAEIDGHTVTLTWDKAASLQTADEDDAIYQVTYNNLRGLSLLPTDRQESSDVTTLGAIVGDAITVQLLPSTLEAQRRAEALRVVFVTTQLHHLNPSGAVSFVFNQPIRFDPFFDSHSAFVQSINTPDDDEDGERNLLAPALDTRVNLDLDRHVLTMTWDKARSLEEEDEDDPIYTVTYGNLEGIRVMPADSEENQDVTTLRLLFGASVTAQLQPYK